MLVKRSLYIDAPVETVFDFMKTMKWADVSLMEIHDLHVTEEGAGTHFSWAVKIAGLRLEGFELFTEVVPSQRITEESAGAFASTWVHTFDPEGTGTRWTIEIRPGSFWRIPPLDRVLGFAFARMGEKFAPRFKAAAEAAAGRREPVPAGQRETMPDSDGARAAKRTIHIEAPVETVFEFLFDSFKNPVKFGDFTSADVHVDDMKATEEGAGTYVSWHMKIAGLPLPVQGFDVLTEVVPRSHITERSSNAMVGTWEYDFEPEGSGTRLTLEHHPRSLWHAPPLRALMQMATDRMTDSFMQRLKDTIETPAN